MRIPIFAFVLKDASALQERDKQPNRLIIGITEYIKLLLQFCLRGFFYLYDLVSNFVYRGLLSLCMYELFDARLDIDKALNQFWYALRPSDCENTVINPSI